MTPYEAIDVFSKYFQEIDNSFDALSNLDEGKIVDLPSYAFGKRFISIFKLSKSNYYLIKIIVDNSLDEDKGYTGVINSNEEIKKITYPLVFDFDLNNIPDDYGFVINNLNVKEVGNPNAVPVIDDSMLAVVREDRFHETFSIQKAKESAIDTWNNKDKGFDTNYSFVHNLKKIFDRAALIIKRKSFLERRVHRFIDAHKTYILPSFQKCYYEHELFWQKERRVADFIIERETGFPALLIELENPAQPVFKKNKELTHQAHHAVSQINEWVSYIDRDSINVANEMEFLSGHKDRLIIIGRGLENIQEMKNSKFSGTTVWTYDLLFEEGKKRWNKVITEQCKSIGIEEPNLLN